MRNHTSNDFPLLTFYFLLLAFLFGCGYRLMGAGPAHPANAKRIAIPTFRNETFEPVLESTLTSYVKEAFITTNHFGVISSADEADLLLKGSIVGFSRIPLSIDQTRGVVLEYRVKIRLDVTLEEPRSQRVLWREPGLEGTADFFVSADTTAARVAQDRAVAEASHQLAQELVSRVLEGLNP